ncbi:MAG: hypothetical protein ACLQDF_02690 [Desulfomonilia bacterium]
MKNLKTKDWMVIAGEAGLFFIVTIVLWLDEFVDVPYRFLGAPKTPYRPQEYILETASVLIVAIVVIPTTLILLRRVRRVERFLRVCAWCRKVWVDDEWVSFEEYALKKHSLQSSHGICEECVTRLEKKNEQKRAGQIEVITNKPPRHMRMRYQKPLQ